MPVAGSDNRQYKRRSLYYYLKVLDQDTGQEIGRLVDIHVAGLLLISEKQLESGQTFNIRIPPDESIRILSCNLDLKAVVRWSNQDINPDYYVSGLQFLEITPVQEDLIEEIVRVIGFKI